MLSSPEIQCAQVVRLLWPLLWLVFGAGCGLVTLTLHLYRRNRLLSELSVRANSRRISEANTIVRELCEIFARGPQLGLSDLLAQTEAELKRQSLPPDFTATSPTRKR